MRRLVLKLSSIEICLKVVNMKSEESKDLFSQIGILKEELKDNIVSSGLQCTEPLYINVLGQ